MTILLVICSIFIFRIKSNFLSVNSVHSVLVRISGLHEIVCERGGSIVYVCTSYLRFGINSVIKSSCNTPNSIVNQISWCESLILSHCADMYICFADQASNTPTYIPPESNLIVCDSLSTAWSNTATLRFYQMNLRVSNVQSA